MDPETGCDDVRDVVIKSGTIVGVVEPGRAPAARVVLDAVGMVVAPGFIDLHSHLATPTELLLQACDGVTTALDLEAGAAPVAREYARCAVEGMPVHYGFSASWALHRMAAAGLPIDRGRAAFFDHIADPAWRVHDTPGGRDALMDRLAAELADGALGIGVLLGYAPASDRLEYQEVAALAARSGVPTFTHARGIGVPAAAFDGAAEVVTGALATGGHAHLCHVHSTSQRTLGRVHGLLAAAAGHGVRISTEAYPYGSGSTAIGAEFLDPDVLRAMGLGPRSIVVLGSGERPADDERLRELRVSMPGALVLLDFFAQDDPDDQRLLERAMLFADTAIASDAMPLPQDAATSWPVAQDVATHPRTTGTFCRALRWLSRDLAVAPLIDVIARATLRPAQILAGVAAAMSRKGRVQAGADADLVVFDPRIVTDRSDSTAPSRTSIGMRHVIVAGTPVVHDGIADPDARPGQPIRGNG